jgi:hypothetical protein
MNTNKSYKIDEEIICKISVMMGIFEDAIKEIIRNQGEHVDGCPGLSETIFYEKTTEVIDRYCSDDF